MTTKYSPEKHFDSSGNDGNKGQRWLSAPQCSHLNLRFDCCARQNVRADTPTIRQDSASGGAASTEIHLFQSTHRCIDSDVTVSALIPWREVKILKCSPLGTDWKPHLESKQQPFTWDYWLSLHSDINEDKWEWRRNIAEDESLCFLFIGIFFCHFSPPTGRLLCYVLLISRAWISKALKKSACAHKCKLIASAETKITTRWKKSIWLKPLSNN